MSVDKKLLYASYTAVEMDWGEIFSAGMYAVSRQTTNLRNKLKDAYGFKGFGFDAHAMGCLSEEAVAKWRDVYWKPLKFGDVDVRDVQVRSVDANHKRLVLHHRDRDDLPYILVLIDVEMLPFVYLRGWIFGRDGKRQEWWEDPQNSDRYAFWVPNNHLHPMSELPPVSREIETATA